MNHDRHKTLFYRVLNTLGNKLQLRGLYGGKDKKEKENQTSVMDVMVTRNDSNKRSTRV